MLKCFRRELWCVIHWASLFVSAHSLQLHHFVLLNVTSQNEKIKASCLCFYTLIYEVLSVLLSRVFIFFLVYCVYFSPMARLLRCKCVPNERCNGATCQRCSRKDRCFPLVQRAIWLKIPAQYTPKWGLIAHENQPFFEGASICCEM